MERIREQQWAEGHGFIFRVDVPCHDLTDFGQAVFRAV